VTWKRSIKDDSGTCRMSEESVREVDESIGPEFNIGLGVNTVLGAWFGVVVWG